MSYKIEFFGWCKEDTHDKVWGWVSLGSTDTLYNFWGRRGKKFTFKEYDGKWDFRLARKAKKKMEPNRSSGTYVEIAPEMIETIIPGFDEEFTEQLVWAKLSENFHGR